MEDPEKGGREARLILTWVEVVTRVMRQFDPAALVFTYL